MKVRDISYYLFESYKDSQENIPNEAFLASFDINEYDDEYYPVDKLVWNLEDVSVKNLIPIMGDSKAWSQWMDDEINRQIKDNMKHNAETFKDMIENGINDEPVYIVKNDKFFIWDGWHRTAASIIRGDKTIKAFVGRPKHED